MIGIGESGTSFRRPVKPWEDAALTKLPLATSIKLQVLERTIPSACDHQVADFVVRDFGFALFLGTADDFSQAPVTEFLPIAPHGIAESWTVDHFADAIILFLDTDFLEATAKIAGYFAIIYA